MHELTSRRAVFQTAVSLTAASYSRVLGANDRINAGVIGTGNLGMRHLRIYMKPLLAEGKVTIAGVSDIYTGAKRRAQEQTRLESRYVHHDYRDLLARKDIDAVYIVTPEHWHHRMALDALDAGKDVYLEKPMTYTIPQAKEVATAVRKTGRVLQVGSQWGSDPLYHHARSVIERGWIGKVLWAQSTYSMNSVHGVWQYIRSSRRPRRRRSTGMRSWAARQSGLSAGSVSSAGASIGITRTVPWQTFFTTGWRRCW
jgi:predicted dehydrogenase